MKRKKNLTGNMLDTLKTGAIWGASTSVVGALPNTHPLSSTTKDFAQSGMSIMFIGDVSKKMKNIIKE